MKEETRLSPLRVNSKLTSRMIVDAIDDEREKQGISKCQFSRAIGNHRGLWQQIKVRGCANLDTIARACDVLGVDIVLVDREGSALT